MQKTKIWEQLKALLRFFPGAAMLYPWFKNSVKTIEMDIPPRKLEALLEKALSFFLSFFLIDIASERCFGKKKNIKGLVSSTEPQI